MGLAMGKYQLVWNIHHRPGGFDLLTPLFCITPLLKSLGRCEITSFNGIYWEPTGNSFNRKKKIGEIVCLDNNSDNIIFIVIYVYIYTVYIAISPT
jgi:hypothetical protein